VDNKKMTRKRDSKGKLKLSNKANGESSNANKINNSNKKTYNSGGLCIFLIFLHHTFN